MKSSALLLFILLGTHAVYADVTLNGCKFACSDGQDAADAKCEATIDEKEEERLRACMQSANAGRKACETACKNSDKPIK